MTSKPGCVYDTCVPFELDRVRRASSPLREGKRERGATEREKERKESPPEWQTYVPVMSEEMHEQYCGSRKTLRK